MRKLTSSRALALGRQVAIRNLPNNGGRPTPEQTAFNEMLSSPKGRLVDGTIYTTKDASGLGVVKFFESADDERAGVSNIAQMKLKPGRFFHCTSICIIGAISSVAINGDSSTLAGLNYGSIAAIKGIEAGELTIRHGGKTVVERMPMTRFTGSDNDRNNPVGVIELDNAITFNPQVDIEATIDLPSGVTLPTKVALRLEFLGSQTQPN